MDPLSIAASIAGLSVATAQIVSTVRLIWTSVSDAPKCVQEVSAEVTGIRACLGQLQSFLGGLETIHHSRAALLMVDQVVVSLTECVLVASELQTILDKVRVESISIVSRVSIGWHEQEIKDVLTRLRASRSTLHLMVAILTCSSVEEAKRSVQDLRSLTEKLLELNQTMSNRLNSFTYQGSLCVSSSIEDSSDASTIRPIRDTDTSLDPQKLTTSPSFGYSFDKDLHMSRVYQRVQMRGSGGSCFSKDAPTVGWSLLSGLSCSDVSNLSVLGLLITTTELYNGALYIDEVSESKLSDSDETYTEPSLPKKQVRHSPYSDNVSTIVPARPRFSIRVIGQVIDKGKKLYHRRSGEMQVSAEYNRSYRAQYDMDTWLSSKTMTFRD